ncbi:MAG: hypothetical protein ACJ8AK_05935 [Gemmatimonadaceae bacterium]
MPELEKLVHGSWTAAYHPVYLACLSLPDFSLASGATYRNEVRFMAAPKGSTTFPQLEVDSINGIYRLHWVLREGAGFRNAANLTNRQDARTVEAISNQFRMTLR